MDDLTVDEMIEAFDTTLTIEAIIWFYVVGIGTVMISTLIPIVYLVKLNPKKVLL